MVTEANTTLAKTVDTNPEYLTLDKLERNYIVATLGVTGGNKSKAAKLLGITLKTLYNKINRYKAEEAGTGATTTTNN